MIPELKTVEITVEIAAEITVAAETAISTSLPLLLLCSRPHLAEGDIAGIDALLRGNRVDWDSFLELVYRNGAVPLVYRNLVGHSSEFIPVEVLQTLSRTARQTAAHNLVLSASLLDTLRLLSEAGIGALPLKGPVLAASCYGQVSLREFEDLDILVAPCDLLHAEALLIRAGFQPRDERSHHSSPPGRGKHLVLRNPDTGVIIELHWTLFEAELHCPFDFQSLWRSAEWTTLLGHPVRTLCPEDQFLFLAAHGWRHGWENLKWVCDIAQLIHCSPDLDWQLIFRRARQMGCRRIVCLALGLAFSLLDAPLPDGILAPIQAEPQVLVWIQEIGAKLGHSTHPTGQAPVDKALAGAGFIRFLMRGRDRLSDRLRLFFYEFALRVKPTPADRAAGLPTGRLRWIARPCRLARSYGWGCIAASSRALLGGLFR